ncbi:MAG: cytochrome c biogenesis protein ResB [Symbiobacteriia bacterium]
MAPSVARAAWRLLTSARVALVLIVAITAATIYGVSFNQQVFGSWWFLTLAAAFLLNTASCTWMQLKKAWRRHQDWRHQDRRPGSYREQAHLQAAGPETGERALRLVLARRGYRVRAVAEQRGRFVAIRFRLGLWGAAFFHVALVVVVLGALVTMGTRSFATFGVYEGERFTDQPGSYVSVRRGLLAPRQEKAFSLTVNRIDLQFDQGGALQDFIANVKLEQGGRVLQSQVDGSHPLQAGPRTFYKNLFGYVPLLTLRDAAGAELGRFAVGLDTAMPGVGADVELKDGRVRYFGDFSLPSTPYQVRAQFYPDAGGSRFAPVLISHVPRSQGLWLEVRKFGQVEFQGLIRPGESAQFGGMSLTLDKVRRWYGFSVIEDHGAGVVFAGAWLALLGLALMYLFIPREVSAEVSATGEMWLGGRAERFPGLYAEEFAALVENLRSEVERA